MINNYISYYPKFEHGLYTDLINLQNEWERGLEKLDPTTSQLFVYDGIVPYYTEQPFKILFIGKESLEVAGVNYVIDILKNCYNANRIGGKTLNAYRFHAIMCYVAYGINRNFPEYKDLPWAQEIGADFGNEGGISFAFMNISKFSNESGLWQADIPLIQKFLGLTKCLNTNYFEKEIELINPDLIIGMNLKSWYGCIGKINGPLKNFGGCVDYYQLHTQYNQYPLLDSWHFSAPKKRTEKDYYIPITSAVKYVFNI